jgi:cytochrome c oxidase cbb3-type subunit 4
MAMDYGTLRGVFALLILALFIIIVAWCYKKKRKSNFDDVANSIFDESDVKDNKENKENKEKINKQETNNNV